MYSPQALWSAAHDKARTIFVVFNNRRYGVFQNVAESLGYANAKAGQFVGMDVVDPAIDFQALAASMGVPAERADDRQRSAPRFERALRREGPSLVEFRSLSGRCAQRGINSVQTCPSVANFSCVQCFDHRRSLITVSAPAEADSLRCGKIKIPRREEADHSVSDRLKSASAIARVTKLGAYSSM